MSARTTAFRRLYAIQIALLLGPASGCVGEETLAGTWQDLDATTALPDFLGGDLLDVDAVVDLDDAAVPGSFEMRLDISHPEGLADSIDVSGSYEDDGTELSFDFEEFHIDAASSNDDFVGEDGSKCINLSGFGGAPVCFPAHQANPYTLDGGTLSIVIEQSISGAPVSETHLSLVPMP